MALEELRSAVSAYFETGSDEFKNKFSGFLKSLDHDEDGIVTVGQFEEFFKERGYEEPFQPSLLEMLGKEQADPIDLDDALLLYYVVTTRMPYCQLCQTLLKGLYFTCVVCYDNEDKTSSLCINCFRETKVCENNHSLFLDNNALLQVKSKAVQSLHHEITQEGTNEASPVPLSGYDIDDPKKKASHDQFDALVEAYISSLPQIDENGEVVGRLKLGNITNSGNGNIYIGGNVTMGNVQTIRNTFRPQPPRRPVVAVVVRPGRFFF